MCKTFYIVIICQDDRIYKGFTRLSISVYLFLTLFSGIILPLHGQEATTNSVTEAIVFLEKYQEINHKLPVAKYEIIIKYNNGDRVEATYKDRKSAIKFLETYR